MDKEVGSHPFHPDAFSMELPLPHFNWAFQRFLLRFPKVDHPFWAYCLEIAVCLWKFSFLCLVRLSYFKYK